MSSGISSISKRPPPPPKRISSVVQDKNQNPLKPEIKIDENEEVDQSIDSFMEDLNNYSFDSLAEKHSIRSRGSQKSRNSKKSKSSKKSKNSHKIDTDNRSVSSRKKNIKSIVPNIELDENTSSFMSELMENEDIANSFLGNDNTQINSSPILKDLDISEEIESPKMEAESPQKEVSSPKRHAKSPKISSPEKEINSPKEKMDSPKEEVVIEEKVDSPKEEVDTIEEKMDSPKEEVDIEEKINSPKEEIDTEEKVDSPEEEVDIEEKTTSPKEEEVDTEEKMDSPKEEVDIEEKMDSPKEVDTTEDKVNSPKEEVDTTEEKINSPKEVDTYEPKEVDTEEKMDSPKEEVDTTEEKMNSPKEEVDTTEEKMNSPKEEVDTTEEKMNSPKEEVDTIEEKINSPKEVDTTEEKINSPKEEVDTEEKMDSPKEEVDTTEEKMNSPKEVDTTEEKVNSPKEVDTTEEKVNSPKEVDTTEEKVNSPKEEVDTTEEKVNSPKEEVDTEEKMDSPKEEVDTEEKMNSPKEEVDTTEEKMNSPKKEDMLEEEIESTKKEVDSTEAKIDTPKREKSHKKDKKSKKNKHHKSKKSTSKTSTNQNVSEQNSTSEYPTSENPTSPDLSPITVASNNVINSPNGSFMSGVYPQGASPFGSPNNIMSPPALSLDQVNAQLQQLQQILVPNIVQRTQQLTQQRISYVNQLSIIQSQPATPENQQTSIQLYQMINNINQQLIVNQNQFNLAQQQIKQFQEIQQELQNTSPSQLPISPINHVSPVSSNNELKPQRTASLKSSKSSKSSKSKETPKSPPVISPIEPLILNNGADKPEIKNEENKINYESVDLDDMAKAASIEEDEKSTKMSFKSASSEVDSKRFSIASSKHSKVADEEGNEIGRSRSRGSAKSGRSKQLSRSRSRSNESNENNEPSKLRNENSKEQQGKRKSKVTTVSVPVNINNAPPPPLPKRQIFVNGAVATPIQQLPAQNPPNGNMNFNNAAMPMPPQQNRHMSYMGPPTGNSPSFMHAKTVNSPNAQPIILNGQQMLPMNSPKHASLMIMNNQNPMMNHRMSVPDPSELNQGQNALAVPNRVMSVGYQSPPLIPNRGASSTANQQGPQRMMSVPVMSPKGMMPQQIPPQGMPPQGLPPKGMSPQGMMPQQIPPQGMPPQGMPPQGMPMSPQGMPPQGMPPQGMPMPPQGMPMSPQGMMPRQIPQQGMMSPQGMMPQQMPPQGMPPQGMMSPQAMMQQGMNQKRMSSPRPGSTMMNIPPPPPTPAKPSRLESGSSVSFDTDGDDSINADSVGKINLNRRPTFKRVNAPKSTIRLGGSDLAAFQKTMNAYRQNVKKTSDPVLQFNYAKFLVNAANNEFQNDKKIREDLLEEGYRFLKKLSNNGYPEAQHYLATFYINDNDWDKALPLLVQAAKHNHGPSCFEVGKYYERKRDNVKANQYYKKAASNNSTAGMHRLGVAFLKGEIGHRKDIKTAFKWFKRAINANESDPATGKCAYELAQLYEVGYPPVIYQDDNYALELFVQGAELQDVKSQYKLGECFERGSLGCPVDAAQSIHWYTVSAEAGDPKAQFALAGWNLTGAENVMDANDQEAFRLCTLSAKQGFPKAEYALGYFYEMGVGVPINEAESHKWYKKAADHGDRRAKDKINGILISHKPSTNKRERRKYIDEHQQECIIS